MNSPQQLSGLPIQAKLTIGEPGDKYEQEADAVAAQVVEQIHAPATAQPTQGQSVQRKDEEETEEVRAKPEISALQRMDEPKEEDNQGMFIPSAGEANAGGEAATDLESAINSARGGGQPIEAGLQQSMGQAMGADFSGVRVHTDAQADELNQSIQALAFTTGQDVFFRQGAYEPGRRGGQELLAHELTHVVQQSNQVQEVIQREIGLEDEEEATYIETEADQLVPKDQKMYYTGHLSEKKDHIFVLADGMNALIKNHLGGERDTADDTYRSWRAAAKLRSGNAIENKKKIDALVKVSRDILKFYTKKGEFKFPPSDYEACFEQAVQNASHYKLVPEGGSVFHARYPLPDKGAILYSLVGQDPEFVTQINALYPSQVTNKKVDQKQFEKLRDEYPEPLAVHTKEVIYLSGGETITEKKRPRGEKSTYKFGTDRYEDTQEVIDERAMDVEVYPDHEPPPPDREKAICQLV